MEYWEMIFKILNKELNPINTDRISEEDWDEICYYMDCIKNRINK